MYKKLGCILLYCCSILNVIQSSEQNSQEFRILKLLPSLLIPFTIEPAVPENFIALSYNGEPDLYNWVYWGPENILRQYFQDPASLDRPLIRVKLSANVAQEGPKGFSKLKEETYLLKNMSPNDFELFESHWGEYPVLVVKAKILNKHISTAWVGLNDSEAGWTLMFNLVYPEKDEHPDSVDREFWKGFIDNTKSLPKHLLRAFKREFDKREFGNETQTLKGILK